MDTWTLKPGKPALTQDLCLLLCVCIRKTQNLVEVVAYKILNPKQCLALENLVHVICSEIKLGILYF